MWLMFYDCETGGLYHDKHSLLTAYFDVCDENLRTIDSLYLQLKPADLKDLNVDVEALRVNGINLQEHLNDPATLTYEEGQARLLAFLEKHKIKGKRKHFRPCGHNIDFDNRFIWHQLIPKETWEKYVHYHQLDTTNVVTFLQDVGFLPKSLNTRLTGLAEYFDIPEIDAHNAMGDIKMNIEVYKRMKSMIIDFKKQTVSSATSNNLIKIIED